jgi:MFS family permease
MPSASAALATTPVAPPVPWQQDARTIGVVGVAHATSHFFHLLLPPLFPAFIQEFGLSYSQLGLLMSVFFVVSGIGQAFAGFVVDRLGGRPVLHVALGCFVAAALTVASAQGYASLVLAAVLLGLGNAPFHPADFSILNQRVSVARLGHAFSAHGISGNLGWAAAPVFMIGLASLGGSWRVAYVGAALLAGAVWLLVLLQRGALEDRTSLAAARLRQNRSADGVSGKTPAAFAAGPSESTAIPPQAHPLAFLKLPVLWMCFAFFFFLTAGQAAIQSFVGPALQAVYGLPLSASAMVVTGFTLVGAVGMVAGGFLSARVQRLELIIGLAMSFSALLMAVVALGVVPGSVALVLCVLAGLGSGLAGPSRDMLIRRAAPPGATGRVYGAVYSGLDAGFAVAAPVLGWLLDRGQPAGIFWGAALAWLVGVSMAAGVGHRLTKAAPVVAPRAA